MVKNDSLSTTEAFFHGSLIRWLTVILVITSGVVLGLKTDAHVVSTYGSLLTLMDHSIIYLLSLEIIIKIFTHKGDFFKTGWNVFNALVIFTSLYAILYDVKALDAVRLLLLLRVVELVPALDKVKVSLSKVLSDISGSVVLLVVVIYSFSVAATYLYGHVIPDKFVDTTTSLSTMLHVIAFINLDSVIHSVQSVHSFSWVFFGAFRLLTLFALVHIVLGIILPAICHCSKYSCVEKESDSKK